MTRTEFLHYSCGCGAVFSLAVVRAVNVETDRDLAEAAVAGALNRGRCPSCGAGAQVSVPYVLHHPHEERLVLVVPEVMRHEELGLRAALLGEIAEARDVAVPDYVRSFQVAFGVEGLRFSLSRPPAHVALRDELAAKQSDLEERERAYVESERLLALRESQLAKRERAIEDQEESVTIREERLKERGEGVTSLEDDLRQRMAEHQARVDNLEARLRLLDQRETALADREQGIAARARTLSEWEARLRTAASAAPAAQGAETQAASPVAGGLGNGVETIVAPAPFGSSAPSTEPSLVGEELATELRRGAPVAEEVPGPEETQRASALAAEDAARVIGEPEEAEELDEEDLIEDAEELSADDLIEDAQELSAGEPSDAAAALARHAAAPVAPPPAGAAPSAEASASPAPSDATEPVATAALEGQGPIRPEPPTAWVRGGGPTWHVVDGSDVCLLARVDEAGMRRIVDGPVDLWVQLHLMEDYPLVALSLVLGLEGDEPEGLHWLLDIEEDDDRAVLGLLRRRFRARVLLYDTAYTLVDELILDPPREVNVAQVIDRATQELGSIPPGKLNPVRARARFEEGWDRLGQKRHPFAEDAYSDVSSPAEARLALGILSYWSEPDNHDYLVLVKSVPVDLFDTITRRILECAVRYGIWLSRPLKERAVALGLAPDVPTLVGRLVEAFAALGPAPEGLDPAMVVDNWRMILRDADELDVPVGREILRAAEDIIEQAAASDDGEDGEPEGLDVGALGDASDQDLLKLIERRAGRKEVALELARRGRLDHLDVLFRAARKMGRGDLAQLLPALLGFGEAAGDYFVEGLTARKSFTRQACAVALGELKLRRAVVPLVHQMLAEKTPVWTEIARALGRYGPSAVKPLQRYLREPRGKEERLVRALAFLAIGGAAKQVEKLRSGTDSAVATLADRALELRDEARAAEGQVQGKRAAGDGAPLLRFSRRLYQSIAGEVLEEGEEELDEEDLVEVEDYE